MRGQRASMKQPLTPAFHTESNNMIDMSARRSGAWPPLAFALALLGFFSVSNVWGADPVERALSPVQSPNDDYAYRLVTLENGLHALLISDP